MINEHHIYNIIAGDCVIFKLNSTIDLDPNHYYYKSSAHELVQIATTQIYYSKSDFYNQQFNSIATSTNMVLHSLNLSRIRNMVVLALVFQEEKMYKKVGRPGFHQV